MLLVTLEQVIFFLFPVRFSFISSIWGYFFLYECLYIMCMQYQGYNYRILDYLAVELHTVVRQTVNVGNQTCVPRKSNECCTEPSVHTSRRYFFVYNKFGIFQCNFDYHFYFNIIENFHKITHKIKETAYITFPRCPQEQPLQIMVLYYNKDTVINTVKTRIVMGISSANSLLETSLFWAWSEVL